MVDTNRLKGIIVQNQKTQEDVAKHIGMTPKTFYLKMKKGVFGSDEMEKMIDYLKIDDPAAIFFCENGILKSYGRRTNERISLSEKR
jgi:hypothetical protein